MAPHHVLPRDRRAEEEKGDTNIQTGELSSMASQLSATKPDMGPHGLQSLRHRVPLNLLKRNMTMVVAATFASRSGASLIQCLRSAASYLLIYSSYRVSSFPVL
jgi:hypothetical protein